MKELAEQMHAGLRLQLAGMEFVTQESVNFNISGWDSRGQV